MQKENMSKSIQAFTFLVAVFLYVGPASAGSNLDNIQYKSFQVADAKKEGPANTSGESEVNLEEAAREIARDRQRKAQEERRKQVEQTLLEDTSVLRTRRSLLDFNNDAISIGEPFVGLGELEDYGLTWFGKMANAIRPRAQFYGTLRKVTYGGRIRDEVQGQLGYTLDAEFNLELTNTERFHVRYQPFVDIDKPQGSGLFRFHNNSAKEDNKFRFTSDTTFVWFEGEIGEMFDSIAPTDLLPTDYHVAFGIVPIIFQNGFLINDNILGLVLSKPNLVWPGTTNVNIQAVAAIDEINAGRAGAASLNDTHMYGVTIQADTYEKFFELNYMYLENVANANLSQHFTAVSMMSNYALLNYSVRLLFNIGDNRASGDGQLYVLETNYPVFNHSYYDKNYVYGNVFYGTAGWNDIARGRTGRAGIFFRGNGLTNFPVIRNTGTDSIGMAYGLKMFLLREVLSINPEFTYLDDRSSVANNQYALGMEIQYIISNHVSVVGKMVGVHNQIRTEDFGGSVEFRFKF